MSINKFIIWLFIFTITMFVGALIVDVADAVVPAETFKEWNYGVSAEGWDTTNGFSFFPGVDGGSLKAGCIGLNCSFTAITTLTGTWETIFGIPSNAKVISITIDSSHTERDVTSGATTNAKVWAWVQNSSGRVQQKYWIGALPKTFSGLTPPYTQQAEQQAVIPTQFRDATDGIKLGVSYQGTQSGSGQTIMLLDDLNIEILYYLPNDYLMLPFFPIAQATTTCEFTTDATTTIASCSDAYFKTQNETQDIATGYILFAIVFFGLIFFFRGRG